MRVYVRACVRACVCMYILFVCACQIPLQSTPYTFHDLQWRVVYFWSWFKAYPKSRPHRTTCALGFWWLVMALSPVLIWNAPLAGGG